MKYVDRLTGSTVTELPDRTLPGRFSVLEPTWHNEHTNLAPGDLLLDDGCGYFRSDTGNHDFIDTKVSDIDEAEADLASEAIVAIYGKLKEAGGKTVSPMLPAEMAAQCELIDIERDLSDVLRAGHLHSISDRPRQDLRYEELISPVARARRLATSALSHLASHSDCWQQRTLSGVKPRKILARFSDDDYAIYENRLYKRLIDRLERHLSRRIARIRGINSRLEDALEFQNSENTHYRLSKDICRLWGEAYLDDKTGIQLEAGRMAYKTLTDQLRSIRGLKQRGLYTLVPRSAGVPDQVHRTNILNHDPHYRHLPPLWEKLRDDRDEQRLRPEDRLARQVRLQIAYTEYVGLVLRRALERFGLITVGKDSYEFDWCGQPFSLIRQDHDWHLCTPQSTTLRFLPIAWFADNDNSFELLSSNTVLCSPSTGIHCQNTHCLGISPLDLYVVERMSQFLECWLLEPLLKNFASPIGPFPTAAKQLIDSWTEFRPISKTESILVAPLSQDQEAILMELLTNVRASDVFTRKLSYAIRALEQLATCHCGKLAKLSWDGNRPKDFYCQCDECSSTWSLTTIDHKRKYSMKPKNSNSSTESSGFFWAGYDCLNIEF